MANMKCFSTGISLKQNEIFSPMQPLTSLNVWLLTRNVKGLDDNRLFPWRPYHRCLFIFFRHTMLSQILVIFTSMMLNN